MHDDATQNEESQRDDRTIFLFQSDMFCEAGSGAPRWLGAMTHAMVFDLPMLGGSRKALLDMSHGFCGFHLDAMRVALPEREVEIVEEYGATRVNRGRLSLSASTFICRSRLPADSAGLQEALASTGELVEAGLAHWFKIGWGEPTFASWQWSDKVAERALEPHFKTGELRDTFHFIWTGHQMPQELAQLAAGWIDAESDRALMEREAGAGPARTPGMGRL